MSFLKRILDDDKKTSSTNSEESNLEKNFEEQVQMMERVGNLESQNLELREQLRQTETEQRYIETQKIRHEREVRKLKEQLDQKNPPPLLVAIVVEILPDGLIYLRQEGTNLGYLTTAPSSLIPELLPGTKVAINQELSIVKVIDNVYDPRLRAMMLKESPNIGFADIGGLTDVIDELRECLEFSLKRPECFRLIGISPPKCILLYGPPGTGKTLIAKAIAHELSFTFIHLSGTELVQTYAGESIRFVRELVMMAREYAPAIIFIDEIDTVSSTLTKDVTLGSVEIQQALKQLFIDINWPHITGYSDVRIIAATNRLDVLDPALLGRFERVIEIPLPDDKDARHQILKIHTREMNLDNVDLEEIAGLTENASGSELEVICREAGMFAIRRDDGSVKMQDFINAINGAKNGIVTYNRMNS